MPNVFITGADRGLGLSLCKEYLNRGWRVFAGKYMEDFALLESLAHPALHVIKLDIGCMKSIAAAKEAVLKVTNSLDMIVSNAALMGDVNCELYKPPMDLEIPWDYFRINALGTIKLVETLLPIMDQGEMKRLCFVSSEAGSITLMKHRGAHPFPYSMSKAAMNMGVRMLHNQLYKDGYSFRIIHPGWMKFRKQDGNLEESGRFDPDYIGQWAAKYFETPRADEHRLAMVDYREYDWPF
ncbi:MAG: SDR family NAD(P)-dependent oxidoreductase [Defluviitaleaceae bacterium]|nr:SDR family NAD(P)-dependent oxidoreductase [Defluviitaleaceae bacterium]